MVELDREKCNGEVCIFQFQVRNVSREMVVRNRWAAQGKQTAGFVDAADFEKIKRKGDAAIQR